MDNPAQPQQIKMCDEGWGEEKKCLFPSSLFLSLLLLHSSSKLQDLVPWVELGAAPSLPLPPPKELQTPCNTLPQVV